MSIPSQYFEVIADYSGIEGNTKYIPVNKGDVVRLIKKKHKYFKVEKDGHIGKVPKGILVQKENQISSVKINQQEQTNKQFPKEIQSKDPQNNSKLKQPELEQQSSLNLKQSHNTNSQTQSINASDNQKSQIISLHSNDEIKQQSENQKQQKINIKPQSGSKSEKHEIKHKDQLHQIMKYIHSIIESNTINDEEKEIQLREIFIELKKKDLNQFKKIFNIVGFKLIQTYINNFTTGIEKILLDIIELIAEKGQQEDDTGW